jgi:hypothetical protein
MTPKDQLYHAHKYTLYSPKMLPTTRFVFVFVVVVLLRVAQLVRTMAFSTHDTLTTSYVRQTNTNNELLISLPSTKNQADGHSNEHGGIHQKQFSWEDIDFSIPGVCGHYKCFFRSSIEAETGYLVTRTDSSVDRFKSQLRGWEIAQDLSRKYNAKHFFLARPIPVNAQSNHSVVDRLNTNLNLPRDFKQHPFFGYKLALVVQKVHVAPPGAVLISCNNRRLPYALMDLSTLCDDKNDSFSDTFQQEVGALIHLLRAEYYLVYDFQVWVDNQGQIYNLDLDRGAKLPKRNRTDPRPAPLLSRPKEGYIQMCTCNLQKLATLLSHKVRKERFISDQYLHTVFSPELDWKARMGMLKNNTIFGDVTECKADD